MAFGIMPHAVLQKNLKPLPVEQLRTAMLTMDSLVPSDALRLAKDAFGILHQGLSLKDAVAFQAALRREGIETDVADERDLIPLSHGFLLRRMDCQPGALVVYDALGRPRDLQWSDVV